MVDELTGPRGLSSTMVGELASHGAAVGLLCIAAVGLLCIDVLCIDVWLLL